MARTQSADYAIRREAIVEAAASLFAARGFLGASIADLADALKTSKSLIYHYYDSKEDILFDVMHGHVATLLTVAQAVAAQDLSPPEKLRALTRDFMAHYAGAAARQRVLLNELANLPKAQRTQIVDIQHKLIDMVQDILGALRPGFAANRALQRPAAMLFFGMINWTHTWMDASGRVSPAQIADLAANIFLDGFADAKIP